MTKKVKQPQEETQTSPTPLEPFDQMLELLPGRVRSHILRLAERADESVEPEQEPVLKRDDLVPLQLRQLLANDVQDKLDALQDTSEEPEYSSNPVWCLCEFPEGEFPKVRLFRSPDNLARYMRRLEGQEVAVWAFYGVPLSFTAPDPKFNRRYLCLPGNQEAILIPSSPTESIQRVDISILELLGLDVQEDGWLGDPRLAEGTGAFYEPPEPLPDGTTNTTTDEEDDDEDDEDDEDEEGDTLDG